MLQGILRSRLRGDKCAADEVGQKAGSRGAAARAVRNNLVRNFSSRPSPPLAMGYYSTYYGLGLPTFTIVVIGLYILLTGELWNCQRTSLVMTRSRVAQAMAKPSMLVASWRNQVLMHGRRLELASA